MNTLMGISAGVGLANIAILIVLLVVYTKVYKGTRAIFTLGLMFFSGLLMLHNIIAVYAYFAMAPLYSEALLPICSRDIYCRARRNPEHWLRVTMS